MLKKINQVKTSEIYKYIAIKHVCIYCLISYVTFLKSNAILLQYTEKGEIHYRSNDKCILLKLRINIITV